MAKKSFSKLPKRAKRAAFAAMQAKGVLGVKHPVTGKRTVVTKAEAAKRKAGLQFFNQKYGVGKSLVKSLGL